MIKGWGRHFKRIYRDVLKYDMPIVYYEKDNSIEIYNQAFLTSYSIDEGTFRFINASYWYMGSKKLIKVCDACCVPDCGCEW